MMDERRLAVDTNLQLLPFLQEDAVRPGTVETVEAVEISPLVGQVVVVREAERHRDVGRFVAFDAKAGLDDVDRQSCRKRYDEEYRPCSHSRASYRDRNGVF